MKGVDDEVGKVEWVRRFVEAQGFKTMSNIFFQDNTSAMKLEINGKASSSKRTRHFDIRIFYVKDLVDQEEVSIVYCPTDEMLADYMSKPTVGAKFKEMRDLIMNLSGIYDRVLQQECVVRSNMSQTGLVLMTCILVSVKTLMTLKRKNKTRVLTGLIARALKRRKKMLSLL